MIKASANQRHGRQKGHFHIHGQKTPSHRLKSPDLQPPKHRCVVVAYLHLKSAG